MPPKYKPVLFGLSPVSAIMAMSRVKRVTLDSELKALGVHEYSVDTDLLFHCDAANWDKLVNIAVKYELALTSYDKGKDNDQNTIS